MKSDRPEDKRAAVAGWSPVLGLVCLVLALIGIAIFHAQPDTTWAEVRKAAGALNKLKNDQWRAKVEQVCRLMR